MNKWHELLKWLKVIVEVAAIVGFFWLFFHLIPHLGMKLK